MKYQQGGVEVELTGGGNTAKPVAGGVTECKSHLYLQDMNYCFAHLPTAARSLILIVIIVNLACWREAHSLIYAALIQCHARTANRIQAFLQRLLLVPILLTSVLPLMLCSVGQLLAVWLLWAGDLRVAALLAVSPILAFLLHLLVILASCLLIGLVE